MYKPFDEKKMINDNFNTITVFTNKSTENGSFLTEYQINGLKDVWTKREELKESYLKDGYEQEDYGMIDYYFYKKEKHLFTNTEINVIILLGKE